MNTFDGFELRQIPLSIELFRLSRADFLRRNGLRDEDADYCVGIFDCDDNLIGTGALKGNIIKDVALSEEARSASLSNLLISHLLAKAAEEGHRNVMLFTKPEYRRTFSSLSFNYVGGCADAILLESDPRGISSYAGSLLKLRESVAAESADGNRRNGVIVMNVNPMTVGHHYLIEKAASLVDHLFIIPVADNENTDFSYSQRRDMLCRATAVLPNVTVCEGSSYTISASTFPSYFLKRLSDATDTHIQLDLDVFLSHIAPALGVSVRFVGTEPKDPLTARYNQLMKRVLPERGVELVEIERLNSYGVPVSASNFRKHLADGNFAAAVDLLPTTSIPVMAPVIAVRALEEELLTTPKPGLVDCKDSGAHDDMDYPLMQKSIQSLGSFFKEVAEIAENGCDCTELRDAGVRAEKKMLQSTGGVNTHRGALFSLGLLVAAVSALASSGRNIAPDFISEEIARMAKQFPRPQGTHGDIAEKKFGRTGALDNARNGYAPLFKSWLPFLRAMKQEDMEWSIFNNFRKQRLLLKIMTELDDSNILYRCGAETADEVRKIAGQLLLIDNPATLDNALKELNEDFKRKRISPGGAADMVALTLFADAFSGRRPVTTNTTTIP